MKVLITGSNGLLGQKLLAYYADKPQYQIIATARGENRSLVKAAHIQYDELDITNQAAVVQCMERHRPNYIIHTAAMTNVDQCEIEKEACLQLNVEATRYLVEACKKYNTFLLHISTDFIFDGANGPYNEEALPNPVSFYGNSKWQAEIIVIASGIEWAIARTALVYGIVPNLSRSNIILWVKKSLEDGKTINVVNDQWRTPTLAEDLATGCALIVQHHAKGIFNISGKDFLNPYQMACKTADFFGLDKNLIVETDGSKFSQTAKRPPRTGFDISKAEQLLGYQPHSFEQGIALLAQQIKEN